jgi:hypothetical protein
LQEGSSTVPANEAYCLQNENPDPEPTDEIAFTPVVRPNARIDGLALSGSSSAPAVMVNAYARYLEVSNNRISNNLGDFAGGVRVGHAGGPLPLADEDAMNYDVSIHHNLVTQNAGIDAQGGGGIVLGTGSDRYRVANNWIAANFTGGQGAGISHIGLSPGGVIDRNTVIFNEAFNQAVTRSGGGIFIGGRPPAPGGLTPGSGDVEVRNNLVQGNSAAAGDGGGIALSGVNGADVGVRARIALFNNMIVNNEAGLAGGGIALEDAAFVQIVHNTIAHNDSLATAGAAFTAGPLTSVPQPAGIVARGHSPQLAATLGAGFSNPLLANTIVWENRSFYYGPTPGGISLPGGDPALTFGLIANAAMPNWDLGVLGAPAGSQLAPQYSVLTSTAGYSPTNTSSAPAFVASYQNGSRNQTIVWEFTTIQAPAAFDEGGNFIRPMFGPLTLTRANPTVFWGNYHVTAGVLGQGLSVLYPPEGGGSTVPGALLFDFDGQPRPPVILGPSGPHRGADQKLVPPAPTTPVP